MSGISSSMSDIPPLEPVDRVVSSHNGSSVQPPKAATEFLKRIYDRHVEDSSASGSSSQFSTRQIAPLSEVKTFLKEADTLNFWMRNTSPPKSIKEALNEGPPIYCLPDELFQLISLFLDNPWILSLIGKRLKTIMEDPYTSTFFLKQLGKRWGIPLNILRKFLNNMLYTESINQLKALREKQIKYALRCGFSLPKKSGVMELQRQIGEQLKKADVKTRADIFIDHLKKEKYAFFIILLISEFLDQMSDQDFEEIERLFTQQTCKEVKKGVDTVYDNTLVLSELINPSKEKRPREVFIPGVYKFSILNSFVRIFLNRQQVDKAIAAGKAIQGDKNRLLALSAIVNTLIEKKQIKEAIEVAETTIRCKRSWVWHNISLALLKDDKIEQSVQIASRISDHQFRNQAFGNILSALIESKKINEIDLIIKEIKKIPLDDFLSSKKEVLEAEERKSNVALESLSRAFIDKCKGDGESEEDLALMDLAVKVAHEITDKEIKSFAFTEIACAFCNLEQPDRATIATSYISDEKTKSEFLRKIEKIKKKQEEDKLKAS